MKEYWEQAERLRRRINHKIHEIHQLRQRAEGMNGSGINDMPRTVSPDRSKMEGTVFKIMALEQDIQETQAEYDALIADMEIRINAVQDGDARDLLTKQQSVEEIIEITNRLVLGGVNGFFRQEYEIWNTKTAMYMNLWTRAIRLK